MSRRAERARRQCARKRAAFFCAADWILDICEKTAPGAAAQEGQDFRTRAEFLQHFMKALADARGEGPLEHLRVRSSGEIGAAKRRMGFQIVAGRRNLQPIGIFFQRGKEFLEPAVFVTVFVRAGPDTELFHVIAHGGHAAGVFAGGIAEIGNDVFDFAEGNEITKGFLPGIKPDGLATVFRNVGAEKFFRLEAGGEEMHIVDKGIGYIGVGE